MTSIQQVVFVVTVCLKLLVAQICSPDDNEYYHPQLQTCLKCDSCLRGAGKRQGSDHIRWDQNHGALSCSPCDPCPTGFFSDIRGYDCKPCNDCSQQNRYQLVQCNKGQNAQCGDFIVSQPHIPETIASSTTEAPSIPETIASSTTEVNEMNEIIAGRNDLINYVIPAATVFTVLILILACFIYVRRRHTSSQENFKINNNLENLDVMQRLPLVVVQNKNGRDSQTRVLKETDTQTCSTHFSRIKSSQTRRLLSNETQPKVLASEDIADNVTAIKTKRVNNLTQIVNNVVKTDNCQFLCCATVLDPSIDDVSKSSLTSGCPSLFSENFLNEKTPKFGDIMFPNTECTCAINRFNCSLEQTLHVREDECRPVILL